MRIVSWNVLHPDHTDVYPSVNPEYLKWEYRLSLIHRILSGYNADIICLQELDSSILIDMPGYTLIYQNDKQRTKRLTKWKLNPETKKPNTLVCGILVKNGFAKIEQVKIGSRSITATLNINGRQIVLTNVHLESGSGVNEIHIKHLSKLLDSDIICGDFNDWIGEPALNYLEQNKFKNGYDLKCPKYTFVHEHKQMLIDHFYSKLKITNIEWIDISGVSQEHPSDHTPIIADFMY